MKLQFFHVKDLCRLMEVIIKDKPDEHILNAGNKEAVSIKEWVVKCYEYHLDVTRQSKIYPETIPLEDGLRDAAKWYLEHRTEVNKKPYFKYIDSNFGVC